MTTGFRGFAILAGIVMMMAVSAAAMAETVVVAPTERIVQAYAEYGIDADTLAKASADLTASERRALNAIYRDDDARGRINGVVLTELWKQVADDETIAAITLAGRVYQVGDPDAF